MLKDWKKGKMHFLDKEEPLIHFLPLFFVEKAWVHELFDESGTNVLVKVAMRTNGLIPGVLDITAMDVFSITNHLPPMPKLKVLFSVIRLAAEKRTGKRVEILENATLVYGGIQK